MDSVTLADGTRVAYDRLANPGTRGSILLVHGSAAHGGWWTEVAAELAAEYDLIIPDLSGHGASDHTGDYSGERWAGELSALLEATSTDPVVVVGHSMGGRVAVYLASLHPRQVARLVLVDVAVRPAPAPRGRERRPYAVYDTAEEAVERYRLRPPSPRIGDAKRRELARRALAQVDRGWTWRSDYRATRIFSDDAVLGLLRGVECPTGLIYGGESPLVNEVEAAYFESVVRRPLPSIAIPGAGHHVPVEAAADCADAIRAMLCAEADG